MVRRYELKQAYRMFERFGTESFDKYDFIAIDGTYNEEENDTISLFELMLSKEPSLGEKSRIFLGKDVVQYALPEDEEAQQLIRRCRKLPNVVYGGQGNTKVNAINKCIRQRAKQFGVVIDDILPKGDARKELLERISNIRQHVCVITEHLNRVISEVDEKREIIPQNETERMILKEIGSIRSESIRDIHKLGQINVHLATILETNSMEREDSTK